MFSINKACGCNGSKSCNHCRKSSDHPKIYTDDYERHGKSRRLFKYDERDEDHDEHPQKNICVTCNKQNCICHDDYYEDEHDCHHCKKQSCSCSPCKKTKCPCKKCDLKPCKCNCHNKHKAKCDDCEMYFDDCELCEIMYCECDEKDDHKHCDEHKGMDLCRKKIQLKCFKHCGPISQPCDSAFYNHFTSRANLDFSGLLVVKNTGNLTSGCSMEVRVTDRAGTSIVAVVNPGASVPIFVESLTSLDIACIRKETENTATETCSGEVIFDLEYYN